jgi:23S rRNA pseudouridine1911/1915/1917 synthase
MMDEKNLPVEIEKEEELYEHFKFEVDKGTELLRIDKYLIQRMSNTSRHKIQQAAKANCILVNEMPVKVNYRVKPLDNIAILLPTPPKNYEALPENISLNIICEDDDIIIINKEAGMVVHPAFANYTGTLLNALLYRFLDKKNDRGEDIAPFLVHRIDKNTSGIMVVAKTESAQIHLAKQFFDHSINRKYLALVWGDFKEDEGTIDVNIGRNPKDRVTMTAFPDGENGKHAVTHYNVIERFGYVTLIECTLETGRTHQIRTHLKYIGHPLFNDTTYGGSEILKGTTFSKYKQFVQNCFRLMPRQALHAKSLGFVHPFSEKYIHFESDLPTDFASVLEKWRNYAIHKIIGEDEE